MATSAVFAAAAAAAGSVPGSQVTFTPEARARIAFNGDDGYHTSASQRFVVGTALPPGGSTCAEPPPEITPTSACEPITAIDFTAALSGNWLCSFFNSTEPSSATRCANSSPPNTSTTFG